MVKTTGLLAALLCMSGCAAPNTAANAAIFVLKGTINLGGSVAGDSKPADDKPAE